MPASLLLSALCAALLPASNAVSLRSGNPPHHPQAPWIKPTSFGPAQWGPQGPQPGDCIPACRPSCSGSSRPGKPCLPPPPKGYYPFKANTSWRVGLGERILAAVTPRLTVADCDGFQMFGDSTWCNKAMKSKQATVGLSFGIEGRDYWSEKMSNIYGLPTRLYDCYASDASSPPLAGKIPNGKGKGKCEKNGWCYETPYQAFHVCLGSKKEMQGTKSFESLEDTLQGQGPLSVHLKMDVEGSEWAVLYKFLSEETEMDKIRTLDMEVHFGFQPRKDPLFVNKSEQESLTLETEVLERLHSHFEVVGSTLEVYREGWHPEKKKPNSVNEAAVHIATGFALPQFAVSFVNKKLV